MTHSQDPFLKTSTIELECPRRERTYEKHNINTPWEETSAIHKMQIN